MINAQNLDYNVALPPTAVASATQASNPIDTLGYHYATIAVQSGPASAVTAPTALTLLESDQIAGPYTPAPGFRGGAAVDATHDFVLPNGSTAVGGSVYAAFNIDTRRRKRFLKLSLTNTVTQTVTVLALLSRADQTPVGTTTPGNVGVAGIVITA